MRIRGSWLQGDDLIKRPVIDIRVSGAHGGLLFESFLIDTGSDRTVLSADFLRRIQLPINPPPPGLSLVGIGGSGRFGLVRTVLELPADDGRFVRVRAECAAFTDAPATDMSILGRDILDIFDVIVSSQRNEVLLLSQSHQYRVVHV